MTRYNVTQFVVSQEACKPKEQMVAIVRCFKLHSGPAKLSMISLMISAEADVFLETGFPLIRLADSRILQQKSSSRGLRTGTKVCNHLSMTAE